MPTVSRGEVTRMLDQLAAGDGTAKENLINLAYGELKNLAEDRGHKALIAEMDGKIAAHMAATDDDWVRRFDRPFR